MPKYHFDLQDRVGISRDEVGQDYDTLEQAIVEARKTLHQMASDEASVGHSALCIIIRQGEEALATVITSTSVLPDQPQTARS